MHGRLNEVERAQVDEEYEAVRLEGFAILLREVLPDISQDLPIQLAVVDIIPAEAPGPSQRRRRPQAVPMERGGSGQSGQSSIPTRSGASSPPPTPSVIGSELPSTSRPASGRPSGTPRADASTTVSLSLLLCEL